MHSASEHGNDRKCCMSVRRPMYQHAESKKDFDAARLGVFAIPGAVLSLPKGPLLTHLKCGINEASRSPRIIRVAPFTRNPRELALLYGDTFE